MPLAYLQAYEPGSLKDGSGNKKYQFALLGSNFFYPTYWMGTMGDTYGGWTNATAVRNIRRSIVPSAMVNEAGDLFTIWLKDFDPKGPRFFLGNYARGIYYDNSWPWQVACENNNLVLSTNPSFWHDGDWTCFIYNFYNAFHPCIPQEVDGTSNYIYCFTYTPSCRMISSSYNYEGAVWVKWLKKENQLELAGWARYPGRECFAAMNWAYNLRRWDSNGCLNNVAYCTGNYQGFVYGNYMFIIFPCQLEVGHQTSAINLIRYACSNLDIQGAVSVTCSGDSGINYAVEILSRFLKVGKYVYFATIADGYFFNLRRIIPGQTAGDNIGTLEKVLTCLTDCYVERTAYGNSWAPYGWDYCILEPDGTPSSPSSPDSGGKILCVFSFGGGGSYIPNMGSDRKWSSTYVSWTYNRAVGVIASLYFDGVTAETQRANAFAQNRIYITDGNRASGTFVDINDTSKTDLYRLYLNSHKMVPYTSPSGRHYLIYAYCYPGKKKHLYLGYAQYFVDANHEVRLLTKIEFKEAGNSGWGDSFGGFTNCDRIISMDLRGGHLWITFMGNENSQGDTSGYYYFHIKASDLIKE